VDGHRKRPANHFAGRWFGPFNPTSRCCERSLKVSVFWWFSWCVIYRPTRHLFIKDIARSCIWRFSPCLCYVLALAGLITSTCHAEKVLFDIPLASVSAIRTLFVLSPIETIRAQENFPGSYSRWHFARLSLHLYCIGALLRKITMQRIIDLHVGFSTSGKSTKWRHVQVSPTNCLNLGVSGLNLA
jgi:hypothetical protein